MLSTRGSLQGCWMASSRHRNLLDSPPHMPSCPSELWPLHHSLWVLWPEELPHIQTCQSCTLIKLVHDTATSWSYLFHRSPLDIPQTLSRALLFCLQRPRKASLRTEPWAETRNSFGRRQFKSEGRASTKDCRQLGNNPGSLPLLILSFRCGQNRYTGCSELF